MVKELEYLQEQLDMLNSYLGVVEHELKICEDSEAITRLSEISEERHTEKEYVENIIEFIKENL